MGNPFVDESTTVRKATAPRIRVTEINPTNVVLAIELIDEDGVTLTFNRACLRAGDTMDLHDLEIELRVRIKEK